MSDLAQVLVALGLVTSLLIVLALILRPYRARWQAAQTDETDRQQQIDDLEHELREERAARRLAESKAEAYDALELEQAALRQRYNTDLIAVRRSEHRMYLQLEAAKRNVRGVREFLAALDLESFSTPLDTPPRDDGSPDH